MVTIRIKSEEILNAKGDTDRAVIDNMTEVDIKRGILADEDTPNLTDEELDDFKWLAEGGDCEQNWTE